MDKKLKIKCSVLTPGFFYVLAGPLARKQRDLSLLAGTLYFRRREHV